MQFLDESFQKVFPCDDRPICWPSVLLDAHQALTKSTIRASMAWFRLISCWKLFRWGSHGFGHAVTESALSSLNRKTSDLQKTISHLFSRLEMQLRASLSGSCLKYGLFLCKAALLRGNSAQRESVGMKRGQMSCQKCCHKLKCWHYWSFWHLWWELPSRP